MTATIATPHRSTRLGQDLTGITDMDEAVSKAGLDWGLHLENASGPMTLTTADGVYETSIPGMRMVMRDDTHTTLGVVGNRYTAIDNHSIMSLGRHFLKQGAVLTEGGELDHGRTVFMRMDLPGCDVPLHDGQDLIKAGVVIKGHHVGGSVTAGLEMTRLICTNGMVSKMKGNPHVFKVAHTASAHGRMAEAADVLAGATQYAKSFAAAATHMLDTPMTRTEFRAFIDGLYPMPEVRDGDSTRSMTIWENRRADLMSLFAFAETNELGRGTRMGAYNAVTEYVDWGMSVRSASEGGEREVRARRRLDQAGQDVKDSAFRGLVPA